jgi:hypothetical protein
VEATGGDTSPEKLRDALLATNIVGPESPQFFAEGDQAATRNIYIVQIQQGADANSLKYVTLKTYENVPPEGFIIVTATGAPTTTTAAPTTEVTGATETTVAASAELGIFFEDLGNNVVHITNVPMPGASFDVTTEGQFASVIEAFDAAGKSLGLLELPEAAAGKLDYSSIADKVAKLVVTDMMGKVFEYTVP